MAKILLILAAVIAGGWFWTIQQPGLADHRPPVAAAATQSAAVSTDDPGKPEPLTNQATAENSPPTPASAQPAGNALSGADIAALGLTRQLAGEHVLTMDGRQQRVLGSKEVVDQSGQSETMLLIRDELSGQISYRKPGLQFTLQDGVDYMAFIGEHRSMRLLFVNPLYAQVAVDAAEIAEQYSALSQDARVLKLRFMTRSPVIKAKG